MKQILRTYLITLLLIFIPFLTISLILSIISYFIHFNGSLFYIVLEIVAYFVLLISALYFTSKQKENRLIHSILFSIIYFIISLLLQLEDINILHLILKSSLFTLVGIVKTIKSYK